ncbi:pseudaminic acid synthase [Hoeflea poritis]|uniref:Pseudaminic acid synthase n=1 Tax=Hoeflea poritis TaxID=2993659 RepID=A0ABT4VVB9_9HYPH|nr:pseudaminic acid synthase [Hoeflea poritis]MDA4848650.1 pseudaminic acid synthase [Hoeflea poritis]
MKQPATIKIAGRRIGPDQPPYVIAEMSGNHNGDLARTFRILEAAKEAGADAVKLQTYRPDTITIDHDGPEFVVDGGLWDGRRLFELYEEAHTPWEWHPEIFARAREIGITVFSSPFDPTAVDFLEGLDAPAYKVASPEIIDLPLIRKIAGTGKPMIISTGMASLDEIGEALAAARSGGAEDIVLLHCTAAYPTPPEEANLATIPDLRERFGVVTGLSDHTLGTAVATTAIALGAAVIEKHFTLARSDGGVDSAFSLEPAELAELVENARIAQAAMGQPMYHPTRSEASVLKNRRSLYIMKPVARDEIFTSDNVRSIRPGLGLKPKHLDAVLGRKAARDLEFGEPLDVSMIAGGLDVQ